jgi:lysophospholipase L1-like esterase
MRMPILPFALPFHTNVFPQAARGMPSQILINVFLALSSVAITLGALEGGARWLGLKTPFFLDVSPARCMQRSWLLSMEFRPNCTGALGGTRFQTNSVGLRSPELRNDGSVRVLAAGDSCTWGWGVRTEQTYTAVLQELLNRRPGHTRYEVINAGVPGATSFQGMLYLQERGLRLKPAIVLAGYGFNDRMPGGDVEKQIRRERLFMPVLHLDDFLLEQSTMYRWLRWRAAQNGGQDNSIRSSPQQYRRHLEGMVEATRAAGARIMLVSFWNPAAPHRSYHDTLAAVGAAMSVPIVWYDGPRVDVVHPSVQGYRLLAAQVADRLVEEGYIPRRSGDSQP